MQTGRKTTLLVGFSTLFVLSTLAVSCGENRHPLNVAGNWSGTLTTNQTPPVQGSATLSLNESGSGSLSGRLSIGEQTGCGSEFAVTGQITDMNISILGHTLLTDTKIRATVDPSAQHMNGTVSLLIGADCGFSGTIVLAKQ
jgi:hypothetical protein